MKRTVQEAIQYIDDFLAGEGLADDWDDFISIPIDDPELERIRMICGKVPDTHPPVSKNEYCNEKGRQALREIARRLGAKTD